MYITFNVYFYFNECLSTSSLISLIQIIHFFTLHFYLSVPNTKPKENLKSEEKVAPVSSKLFTILLII